MTTINGITCNRVTLFPVATHRNVVSNQPGSDQNYITDMGFNGLILQLTGYEETFAAYQNVISEFMKSGEQTLIHYTGWQYKVYSAQLSPTVPVGFSENYFPYTLVLLTSTPYMESTTETTRTKTITTNNQEWSQDDSANDIDTDGSVDAIPDIQITGDCSDSLDQNGWTMVMGTTFNSSTALGQTFTQGTNRFGLTRIQIRAGTINIGGVVTLNVWNSPSKTTLLGSDTIAFSTDNDVTYTFSPGAILSSAIQYYFELITPNVSGYIMYDTGGTYTGGDLYINGGIQAGSDLTFKTYGYDNIILDPDVYNTADSTTKCAVANKILNTAIHRINVDGTGTINFQSDIDNIKFTSGIKGSTNCAYDGNEIDISDDGYIYWEIDTKYPITGIPTLTSQINITAGTPTIQIAADSAGSPDTWYDITTAIVDDVETVYGLDSSSLHLKGNTIFYFRYDCVKAAAATCSIKNFELDGDFVTIDVEHPKITSNGASTFRCNQDAASGINCNISLIYRDRSWPV